MEPTRKHPRDWDETNQLHSERFFRCMDEYCIYVQFPQWLRLIVRYVTLEFRHYLV